VASRLKRSWSFHGLLTHAAVGFNVTIAGIGKSAFDSHIIRNDMQHNNPAATVDILYLP
jgi:hypothetical protein